MKINHIYMENLVRRTLLNSRSLLTYLHIIEATLDTIEITSDTIKTASDTIAPPCFFVSRTPLLDTLAFV